MLVVRGLEGVYIHHVVDMFFSSVLDKCLNLLSSYWNILYITLFVYSHSFSSYELFGGYIENRQYRTRKIFLELGIPNLVMNQLRIWEKKN